MLLVVNGAPGVGKSLLAARYADDHPLALVVDIDDVRRHLGGWKLHEESKRIARELAVALARDHIARGHDVIVPQYLGRRELVDRLRNVSEEAGARAVEVILTDDVASIVERFFRRRAELSASGFQHPESDLHDDAVVAEIEAADAGLHEYASAHDVPMIDMAAGLDAAYDALRDLLTRDR